jgi:hypothetical protein
MICIELVGNAHRLDVMYLADSITIVSLRFQRVKAEDTSVLT